MRLPEAVAANDPLADIRRAVQAGAQIVRRMMIRASNRQLSLLMLAGYLLLANCREQPPSYSSPPGAVDTQPDTFWGPQYPDNPPEIDGRPFDPTGGLSIQKFADRLIGKHIATFVGHGWETLRNGPNVSDLFTPAELGPGPGICTARRFRIMSTYSRATVGEVKASEGEWSGNVYTVAGSVAPLPQPWSEKYKARLLQACRKRTDMDMWYAAEPRQAYLAARIADAVAAAAKRPGRLAFDLQCTPFPKSAVDKPLCKADVRKSVASINPRAIIEVGDCFAAQSPSCLAIQVAKMPERSSKIWDRWTLNVLFDPGGSQVRRVDVDDTQLIID